MKNRYKLWIPAVFFLLLQSLILPAQNNDLKLGGGTGQLDIRMQANGMYQIFRNGNENQFYSSTPIFAIRFGSTSYASNIFTIGNDVIVNNGTRQERTKTFTHTHEGNAFSIIMKFTYNTSNPDYMVKEATLDLTNIPPGTDISFAYGWDAYVNGCDGGSAITVPDLGHNTVDVSINLTDAEVQSLRLAGGINDRGNGSLIAFFPMGRNFDRAYSAYYVSAYASMVVISTANNLFKFGPYTVPSCIGGSVWDNGVGVVYDNLPGGEISKINTGLTFTTNLDGELDYTWNGSKKLIANLGDDINLNLKYTSYNPQQLSGIGFKVDLAGLKIREGYSDNGFISRDVSSVPGNNYYQLSNGVIAPQGTADMIIPVSITQCGQWEIDGNAISEMHKTLPLGAPATLIVKSTVSFPASGKFYSCKGGSHPFAVKFPEGIIPAHDAVINLTYTGDLSDFTYLPTTVTIPAGQNSAEFYVTAASTAKNNAIVNITLNAGSEFVEITEPNTLQVQVLPSARAAVSGPAMVCHGSSATFTASAPQVPNPIFRWYTSQTDPTPIHTGAELTVPAITAATSYYVSVMGDGICENLINDRTETTVTVTDALIPGSVSTAISQTCKGNTVTVTGTPSSGGTGTFTYQWQSSPDGTNWTNIEDAVDMSYTHTSLEGLTYFRRLTLDECGSSETNQVRIAAVPEVMYWSKTPEDYIWSNPNNWTDETGKNLYCYPEDCADVHIPGNSSVYPDLSPTIVAGPICKNIIFHFGAEVAKHNYLEYQKAYIQYNFGYYQGATNVYRTDGDPHSATPMLRNRWYALAAPLKKIASGDFSVGGYPNLWQQGFRSTEAYDGSLIGDWYSPAADIALPMENTHHGISIWAARMQPFTGESNHSNLNALKGIIELPYFENQTVSELHRIHTYENGTSTFKYYKSDDLSLTDSVGTIARAGEAYRFITEGMTPNAMGELTLKVTVPAGVDVMIGNPFLSSLDFNRFYSENAGVIENYYRLYEHPWNTSAPGVTGGLIPSFQSFFIKTLGLPGSTVDLHFPISASVTRTGNYQLKSAVTEKNILTTQVQGSKGSVSKAYAVLKEDGLIRNVPQMFVNAENDPEAAELPQLFVKGTDNSKYVIYKEERFSSDVTLTLGVRSTVSEEFTLSFDNLNSLSATDIRLTDKITGWVTDLKNTDSYTFTHDPENEDRFELSISGLRAPTGIEDNSTDDASINVYAYERTVRIESSQEISKVSVYGTGGLLLSSQTVSGYTYSKEFPTTGLYIVSVELQDGTKEVRKVILK